MRRNSRPKTVTFGSTIERRSRRTVSEMRAEARDTMNVRSLAAFYEKVYGRSAPSVQAQRATAKALKAIFLRGVADAKAVEAAMMTLPANYGADQLGAWYTFTTWAIKRVGRSLL